MRSLTLCCLWLLLLTSCNAPQFRQEKLQDGSIKVSCELSMDECVRRAQEACENERYRILEGTSETRFSDVPPYERAYHTSRLHFECTNDGGQPLFSLGSPAPVATHTEPPPPANPPVARSCGAGETRVCVGAGACKGGQACLTDGSGFGPCDCGPVAPAPASDVAPAAGATAPATPTP